MMRPELPLRSGADANIAFAVGRRAAAVKTSIETAAACGSAISAGHSHVQRMRTDLGDGESLPPGFRAGMYIPDASRKLFKINSKKVLESVKSDALADFPSLNPPEDF